MSLQRGSSECWEVRCDDNEWQIYELTEIANGIYFEMCRNKEGSSIFITQSKRKPLKYNIGNITYVMVILLFLIRVTFLCS